MHKKPLKDTTDSATAGVQITAAQRRMDAKTRFTKSTENTKQNKATPAVRGTVKQPMQEQGTVKQPLQGSVKQPLQGSVKQPLQGSVKQPLQGSVKPDQGTSAPEKKAEIRPKERIRVNPYANWKKIKDLRLGSRSQRVWLLASPQNPKIQIVLKSYDVKDASHRYRFAKEVSVLKRLRGFKYAPRLLFIDQKEGTMWMTYCGPVAKLTKEVRAEVESHLKELATTYGVHRVTGPDKRRRLDCDSLFPQNITQRSDGRVAVIDYGSGSWTLSPRSLPTKTGINKL
jgi:hypothetical protein